MLNNSARTILTHFNSLMKIGGPFMAEELNKSKSKDAQIFIWNSQRRENENLMQNV